MNKFKEATEFTNHDFYNLIDSYKFPDNLQDWLACKYCMLKPKIWEFANGRFAACGCHNNKYDHFNIQATTFSEYQKSETIDHMTYKHELQNNWNNYQKSKTVLLLPDDSLFDS